MKLTVDLDTETEAGRYLLACARIRQIHPTVLCRRILQTVGEDQLVLSVLDDDSKPYREKGDFAYKGPAIGVAA